MTLDEAIKHCEDKAQQCGECGKEHVQLAEWLKELKRLKEAEVVEMWVARDNGDEYSKGEIFLYDSKPRRNRKYDMFCEGNSCKCELPEESFPKVTWGNSPRKVRLILEDEE
jgi:hypothetical protein